MARFEWQGTQEMLLLGTLIGSGYLPSQLLNLHCTPVGPVKGLLHAAIVILPVILADPSPQFRLFIPFWVKEQRKVVGG